MDNKYIIVDKSILPECYEKVIEARTALNEGKFRDVSEAVKSVGISRSTYYKYKDFVFAPNDFASCRKATISFSLAHEAGKLGEVIKVISSSGANILTITQNLPINGKAHVVISIDFTNSDIGIDDIIKKISDTKGTSGTKLIAVD